LAKVGDVNRSIVSFFESVFAATMKVTDWIMLFAAPGIFALTAVSVSNFGLDIFTSISEYLLVLLIGFGIQLCVVYPLFLKIFSKVPVLMLYAAIAEAMMVAFGTASSSATLPLTIACCEKRGISHKVSSFVLPLGATLSMDGTALLQVVAVIFLTQAYGVVLTPFIIIQIAILAMLASSTCAGIPGAGLITIALVLNGLGLSPEQLVAGFAFLFTIDRISDMFRTLVNVTSDAVVAAAIADNENEINYDLLTNVSEYNEII
jgi:Na+/H+-dicarboxylate symporter